MGRGKHMASQKNTRHNSLEMPRKQNWGRKMKPQIKSKTEFTLKFLFPVLCMMTAQAFASFNSWTCTIHKELHLLLHKIKKIQIKWNTQEPFLPMVFWRGKCNVRYWCFYKWRWSRAGVLKFVHTAHPEYSHCLDCIQVTAWCMMTASGTMQSLSLLDTVGSHITWVSMLQRPRRPLYRMSRQKQLLRASPSSATRGLMQHLSGTKRSTHWANWSTQNAITGPQVLVCVALI